MSAEEASEDGGDGEALRVWHIFFLLYYKKKKQSKTPLNVCMSILLGFCFWWLDEDGSVAKEVAFISSSKGEVELPLPCASIK